MIRFRSAAYRITTFLASILAVALFLAWLYPLRPAEGWVRRMAPPRQVDGTTEWWNDSKPCGDGGRLVWHPTWIHCRDFDGLMHGPSLTRHRTPDGGFRPFRLRHYQRDRLHGLDVGYMPDGSQRYRCPFDQGQRHGPCQFFIDGPPLRWTFHRGFGVFFYTDGHRVDGVEVQLGDRTLVSWHRYDGRVSVSVGDSMWVVPAS